jgi:hypothetical protein
MGNFANRQRCTAGAGKAAGAISPFKGGMAGRPEGDTAALGRSPYREAH